MTQQLHNPFNTTKTELKMKVWHKGHELCEKEFGYQTCKKDTITFRMPHIIATKVDDFCQKHRINFDNEQHQLPSGKIIWFGCPVCQRNDKKYREQQDFVMYMKDIGMRWNEDTKEFFKPCLPGGETTENKYKPISRRDK